MTLVLRYIARSDRGLVRSNNEDSAYAGPRLLALADGMGGHAAGEVASQLVIQALSSLDDDDPSGDLLADLNHATQSGNQAIADQVEHSPELDGMGTTLTAILFAGTRIGLCHIGDSRGYLYRDGEITQITRDDTFVQTLVDEGRITAEQAHTHPQRSLIMRALTGSDVEPTLTMREARAGDRYLLCSDGLSDVVSEETLGETLGSIADYKECADRLIELALRGGGPDNVTVVLADVVDTEYGDSRPIIGGAAGGGEDSYTPDPKTAAGRAAALRPPPAEPARPTVVAEETPARRSHLGRWVAGAVTLLVIAALVIGFFVVRSVVRSSYYVGADSDSATAPVLIYQGSPDTFLFFSSSTPAEKGCIVDPASNAASIKFIPVDSNARCDQLTIGDLVMSSTRTIQANDISKLPLNTARERATQLDLRRLCVTEILPRVPDQSLPGTQPIPESGPGATTPPGPEPATFAPRPPTTGHSGSKPPIASTPTSDDPTPGDEDCRNP